MGVLFLFLFPLQCSMHDIFIRFSTTNTIVTKVSLYLLFIFLEGQNVEQLDNDILYKRVWLLWDHIDDRWP